MEERDLTKELICIFFTAIFFTIGIITLPLFIGVFFIIAGFYCKKKANLTWSEMLLGSILAIISSIGN